MGDGWRHRQLRPPSSLSRSHCRTASAVASRVTDGAKWMRRVWPTSILAVWRPPMLRLLLHPQQRVADEIPHLIGRHPPLMRRERIASMAAAAVKESRMRRHRRIEPPWCHRPDEDMIRSSRGGPCCLAWANDRSEARMVWVRHGAPAAAVPHAL